MSYAPKVYRKQGGDEMVVASGGDLTVETGGTLEVTGRVLAATNSLTAADNNRTVFLNHATEFTTTLPAIADVPIGWNVRFIVTAAPSGAAYVITEDAASDTDVIVTNGINELEVDTGDDGPSNTGHTTITFADGVAVAGDWVFIVSDGTNYYATGQTKADGGITLA